MSDYTITTDFGAKDSLPSGNAAKIIKGSEFTTEFTNIKTAIATKANTVSPTFTGNTALDGATTFGANGTSTFNGTVNFTKDVTFDTNTLFVDVSENRVGIGNVAPATALDVTGVITTDGLTSSAGIDVTGVITTDGLTSSAGIDITGTVTASGLTVDTNTLHVDATNNRVGIGTSSPANTLTVGDLEASASDQDATVGIKCNANHKGIILQENSGAEQWEIGVGEAGSLKFYDSGSTTPAVTFIDGGNVGIGTDSPDEQLVVKCGLYSANQSGGMALQMGDEDGSHWKAQFKIKSDGSGVPRTVISGVTNNSGSSIDAINISNTGNVGIGTDSPLHKVDITGDESTAYDATSDSGQSNHDATLQVFNNNTTDESFASLVFRNRNTGVGISRISSIAKGSGTTDMSFVTENSNIKSEKLRIKADGKVGIGTSNPDKDLHITTTTYGATIRLERNQSEIPAGGIIGAIEFESGDVSAGSTGVVGKIEVRAEDTTPDTNMRFYTHDNDSGTGTLTEQMRIDSSGNLLVGTTSNVGAGSQGVQITGTGEILTAKSSTALRTHLSFINSNGIVGSISTSDSATAYNTSSDERLKQNIQDADDAGSKVDAIQIRQFDWKADGSHQDYGVIAQELATVAPEAVHQPEDSEEIMGVDYSKLVPMLIKEVQSLRSRVAELENI